MSWALVKGAVFYCVECNKSIQKVRFINAAIPIQVSDYEIRMQEIKKLHLGLAFYLRYRHYYVVLGYCARCIKRVMTDEERDFHERFRVLADRLEHFLIEARRKTAPKIKAGIEKFFDSIDIDGCKRLAVAVGESEKTINDILQCNHPKGKRRMVKRFVRRNSRLLINYLHEYIRQLEDLGDIEAEYAAQVEPYLRELKNLLSNPPQIFYEEHDTSEPINLNPFISYSATHGYPVPWTRGKKFYIPRELDWSMALERLCELYAPEKVCSPEKIEVDDELAEQGVDIPDWTEKELQTRFRERLTELLCTSAVDDSGNRENERDDSGRNENSE